VRRGLAATREQAQVDIRSGRVLVGGAPAAKPSHLVAAADPVEVLGPPSPFVGRGGHKLDGALTQFALDVGGRRCLDAGASTGGFTDCLLQRGAGEVVAVDVGYGQLHEQLRRDTRVRNLERTNVRSLNPSATLGLVSVVVADLSFISLRTVLPALVAVAEPGADLVLLVKPQFEAGRRDASRGRGVVRDPAVWRRVLDEVVAAVDRGGASTMGAMVSPLTGADGNVEFFLHGRNGPPGPPPDPSPVDLDALVAEALAGVGA